MHLSKQRQQVAETALAMLDSGLVINTSGNVSIRVDDHVAITPSGMPYTALEPRDICVLTLEGDPVDGHLLPSSETPLHLSVYKASDHATAIVHTHSLYATAVSTVVKTLPAIHYQIVDLGGPVPVAPYRTFGTQALADVVTTALKGRTAVLMQNHGLVAIGDSLDQAYARATTLEWLCRVFLLANDYGDPNFLDEMELLRVKQAFEDNNRARDRYKKR